MRRVDGADLAAVMSFARAAIGLLGEGVNEQVLKQSFLTHLPDMFPSRPTWIARHTRGAEAHTRYADDGQLRKAFMDNVVGYTSVEWEHDLGKRATFDTGYEQVRTHVAGQINSGAPVEQVIGVLSDTVRWYAYRVGAVRLPGDGSPLGPGDVDLVQERRLDISGDTSHAHAELAEFLVRYFGREGAQPLTADMIAFDLGIGSEFCERSQPSIAALVDRAMAARPDYASVIERLWSEFVAYLGGEPDQSVFDAAGYAAELYTVTLAKLICANVIAREGLHSNDEQLRAILCGDHFKARGFVNLVEYDYFGWLNERPFVDGLIPVAREMQADLRAYDFLSTPQEDVFGHLLAELAYGQRRILLGQEWTPTWLARQMAREMVDGLPAREQPRFVDMCCGSGSMLVQVVHAWLARAGRRADASASELASALTQVATGFDVDPLAVMLAKVNWVIATHAHLDSFVTGQPVVIPIYLADSLWAKTPIGAVARAGAKAYTLALGDQTLTLPAFLVRPTRQRLFDALLDHAHSLAAEQAAQAEGAPMDPAALDLALQEACADASDELDGAEGQATRRFLHKLVAALSALQRDEVNGIWTFVLRNSYRPGLMARQFNGLISNPPWLTLSKVANNPYRRTLRATAAAYGIKSKGQSHPHTELATTFLLAATDRYLREGATIACVLPDTVLNGHHHTPFRERAYARARPCVDLQVTRLWRVQRETFKNEAIVLFAARLPGAAGWPLPGAAVGLTSRTPLTFHTGTLQDMTIWTDRQAARSGGRAGEMGFRQGADVMPRSTVFHQVTALAANRWRIAPIDEHAGLLRYLLAQGKRLRAFRITPTVVPGRFLFPVFISKHLAPFALSEPALALLPIERSAPGARWRPVSKTRLAAAPAAATAFGEIFAAHDRERPRAREFSLADYFAALDTHRRKLTAQRFPDEGYLVLYGAGGSWPCAATLDLSGVDARRLIVDQTLYWLWVEDEPHALYLAGLINSKATREPIREFQPRGSFDERHVHKLPGRVIPLYDPTCPEHAAVVDATRALSEEFAALRESGSRRELFDPSRGLAWRRRMIRTKVLPHCRAYAPYARACRDLYFSAAGQTIR